MSNDAVVQALVGQLGRLQEQVEKLVSRTVVSNDSAYFSAWANATTPVGAGATVIAALSNTVYTDGNFASNTYTCPVAGNYLFCGKIRLTGIVAGYCQSAIYQNTTSAAVGAGLTPSGTTLDLPVAAVVHCAAGDLITLRAYSAGGATIALGQSYTYLMGQIQ